MTINDFDLGNPRYVTSTRDEAGRQTGRVYVWDRLESRLWDVYGTSQAVADAQCKALNANPERPSGEEQPQEGEGLDWLRYRAEEVSGGEDGDLWMMRDKLSGTYMRDAGGKIMYYTPAKAAFWLESRLNRDEKRRAMDVLRGL